MACKSHGMNTGEENDDYLSSKLCCHLCLQQAWPWLSVVFGIFVEAPSFLSPKIYWQGSLGGVPSQKGVWMIIIIIIIIIITTTVHLAEGVLAAHPPLDKVV